MLPPIPEIVRKFREKYRAEVLPRPYSGRLHFAITNAIGLSTLGFCAWHLKDVKPWEWAVIPATFLLGNFGEYHFHRGPMHHRWERLKAAHRRHTLRHHRFYTHEAMHAESTDDFQIVLFPLWFLPLIIFAFAVPLGLAARWVLSPNAGYLVVFTLTAYFLNYEWLHLVYHLPEDHWAYRIPYLKKLRKLHENHHNPELMQRWNFNITYPVADWFYGTLWKAGHSNSRPEEAA